MADILIKGMDMPQSCVNCLLVANEGYCCVTQKTARGTPVWALPALRCVLPAVRPACS